ncbi:hypothetical protein PR048_025690 [Dryococelus australis]|uniref:Secreted protein n=1 Tax=Dryococelus australis TaxID=614101 RepID=A0ABQ9GJB3_9NEOP|nr:hypothetical protein PR048_025690 [Dryococelus australis]
MEDFFTDILLIWIWCSPLMSSNVVVFYIPMFVKETDLVFAIDTDLVFAIDVLKCCCVLHTYVRERDGFVVEDTLTVGGLGEDTGTSEFQQADRSRPREVGGPRRLPLHRPAVDDVEPLHRVRRRGERQLVVVRFAGRVLGVCVDRCHDAQRVPEVRLEVDPLGAGLVRGHLATEVEVLYLLLDLFRLGGPSCETQVVGHQVLLKFGVDALPEGL